MKSDFHIDYASIGNLYAKEQLTGTLYLAFRDIPQLVQTYLKNSPHHPLKILDFGCGTGVSTRYLKSLQKLFKQELDIQGADVSAEVLKLASEADPRGVYHQIHQGKIPVLDHTYDLIFSSFVLFEFASKNSMRNALEEVKRVMKKGALFIAVTGSSETYNRNNQWVSLKVDFQQNDHLKSGDLARVDFVINEEVITFQNYYWTQQDYQEVFQQAGLHLQETLHPLGDQKEECFLSWQWKSETHVSPYYTFILCPSKQKEK